LAGLAARQFGVVAREQLLALGSSAKEISGMVRRGLLHPLYRGVYAVGHTRVVPHARLIAALLSCGPASFLSHRTAAAAWGLRELNLRRIEVTVPGDTPPSAKSWSCTAQRILRARLRSWFATGCGSAQFRVL
jgi:hypothetical protein